MSYQHALTGLTGNQNSLQANRQIDYYVDGALGDDTNLGTMESPFKTIQAAINASDESNNAGHNNIYINAGEYEENLSISDDDLLTINGLGTNSWDVSIKMETITPSDFGAFEIDGGEAVALSNLSVSGSRYGIYAMNIGQLALTDVLVANNVLDGIYISNITEVDLLNTRCFGNRNGVVGTDLGTFSATTSYFHDNTLDGISLENGQLAAIVNCNVMRNGREPQFGIQDQGVAIYDFAELEVTGGNYFSNTGFGIYSEFVDQATFTNIGVFQNTLDGLEVFRTGSLSIFGGNYSSNQRNGISARGFAPGPEALLVVDAVTATNNFRAMDFTLFATCDISNLNLRGNSSNGLTIDQCVEVNIDDSTSSYNGRNGVFLSRIEDTQINGLVASHNEASGLFLEILMDRTAVNNSVFQYNDEFGIRGLGIATQFSGQLILNNCSATYNGEGFKSENFESVQVTGGSYSFNSGNGFQLIYFESTALSNVAAIGNGGSGARFNLGRSLLDVDHSNKHSIEINGGTYFGNGHHGLLVSTYYDRSPKLQHLFFTAANVVASMNYRSGIAMLNEHVDSPGAGEGPYLIGNRFARATVVIDGAQLNQNRLHGATIFANPYSPFFQQLDASVNAMTAISNGATGLSIGTAFTSAAWYAMQQPANDAWISVADSKFNRNGLDGVRLQFNGRIAQHDYQQVALINQIEASFNGASGLAIRSGLLDEQLPDASMAIHNSRFNENLHYGINVYRQIDSSSTIDRTNVANATFEDVVASANKMSGVFFGGPNPNNLQLSAPVVNFTGGEMNGNDMHGIDVYNVKSLTVDATNVKFNDVYGIHGRYVQMADVASAIATGNGDQDIKISSGAG